MDMYSVILAAIIIVLALAWPFAYTAAKQIYKMFEAQLPENVEAVVRAYAEMAVQYVEQRYASSTNEEKKTFAIEAIKTLLEHAHLPIPEMAVLDIAVEVAVYALNLETKQ